MLHTGAGLCILHAVDECCQSAGEVGQFLQGRCCQGHGCIYIFGNFTHFQGGAVDLLAGYGLLFCCCCDAQNLGCCLFAFRHNTFQRLAGI